MERPELKWAVLTAVIAATIGWAVPEALGYFWPSTFSVIASAPVVTATMCAFVGLMGYVVGLHAGRSTRKLTRGQVKARCATLSPRKRAILLTALKNGDVLTSALDTDAYGLGDMGLLKSNPIGSVAMGVVWFVNPDYLALLKRKRDKWIGSMTEGEREKLIG